MASKMSDITMPASTSVLINIEFARTRFTSCCITASYISRPIPGYEKIISRTREPEKRLASKFALPVMYGFYVFLNAWLR